MYLYPLIDTVLFSMFSLLAGQTAASRINFVADWHYPLNNSQSDRSRRSRLYFRSLISARVTASWLRVLWSDPSRVIAAEKNPDLLEKIHRPYLRKDFGCSERMALLRSHYEFTSSHPHGNVLNFASWQGDFLLSEMTGKSGKKHSVVLGPAGSLQKEGELVLRLNCEGVLLMSLAFTFGDKDGKPVLFVGCLQGSADATNRDAIRDATKDMFGLRPRQLSLIALQSIARVYGAVGIVGVCDSLHIYRHWRKQRKIMQSYDAIWSDLGGSPGESGLFDLPLIYSKKPLTDYPSNKRSMMAKRHDFERQIIEQIEYSITHGEFKSEVQHLA